MRAYRTPIGGPHEMVKAMGLNTIAHTWKLLEHRVTELSTSLLTDLKG